MTEHWSDLTARKRDVLLALAGTTNFLSIQQVAIRLDDAIPTRPSSTSLRGHVNDLRDAGLAEGDGVGQTLNIRLTYQGQEMAQQYRQDVIEGIPEVVSA